MNSAENNHAEDQIHQVVVRRGDVLLLDIEGTICPITFVRDVLFPYARNNVHKLLDRHFDEYLDDIKALRELANEEIAKGDLSLTPVPDIIDFSLSSSSDESVGDKKAHLVDATCQNVNKWMDRDKKYTALKQLQGHLYKAAFQGKLIKSNFYADVVPVLRTFHQSGVKICVYSSGSVEAQKLFFKHSTLGDISDLIHDYFDTQVGLKTGTIGYSNIVNKLNVKPQQIVFLTDVEREAYPAAEVGVRSVLVVRDGNEALSEKARKDFDVVESFDQLTLSPD